MCSRAKAGRSLTASDYLSSDFCSQWQLKLQRLSVVLSKQIHKLASIKVQSCHVNTWFIYGHDKKDNLLLLQTRSAPRNAQVMLTHINLHCTRFIFLAFDFSSTLVLNCMQPCAITSWSRIGTLDHCMLCDVLYQSPLKNKLLSYFSHFWEQKLRSDQQQEEFGTISVDLDSKLFLTQWGRKLTKKRVNWVSDHQKSLRERIMPQWYGMNAQC